MSLYIFLFILLLLTGYFFIFPISKKRPVLIKRLGLALYVFVLVILFFSINSTPYAAAVIIGFVTYLLGPWFIFGITSEMISDALRRAVSATRSDMEEFKNNFKINGDSEIRIYSLSKKTKIILFKKINKSKKAILTQEVFRKFILNYFLS